MSQRTDRIGDEIRDIIGACFTGGRLGDPRLKGVTVTHVRVTKDLQQVYVYFRMFGTEECDTAKAVEALNAASGYFKKQIKHGLRLRRIPNLSYFYDETVTSASRIESLLANLN